MKPIVATLSLAALLTCTGNVLAAGDAKAGKDVFLKKCSTCHGEKGEGKETIAKTLKVELKHLGSAEVQTKTDEQIRKIVMEGEGKMKLVKDMDAKAVDDAIAFIRTLKKK